MKSERSKLMFWSTILIVWTIASCTYTGSIPEEPKRLVITQPVIIECTGPVTYTFKQSPIQDTWWWRQYINPWLLPALPPVQPEHQCYRSTVGGEKMMPRDTKAGIDIYVDRGVPTGAFLYAVLSNNLMETLTKADAHNKDSLQLICEYIRHFTPSLCHGSPERVSEWLALHKNVPKSAYALAGQDRDRREAFYKPKVEDDDD